MIRSKPPVMWEIITIRCRAVFTILWSNSILVSVPWMFINEADDETCLSIILKYHVSY